MTVRDDMIVWEFLESQPRLMELMVALGREIDAGRGDGPLAEALHAEVNEVLVALTREISGFVEWHPRDGEPRGNPPATDRTGGRR